MTWRRPEIEATSVKLKLVRIIAATALAVVVFQELGLVTVGLLAVATQLTAVLLRRRRTQQR